MQEGTIKGLNYCVGFFFMTDMILKVIRDGFLLTPNGFLQVMALALMCQASLSMYLSGMFEAQQLEALPRNSKVHKP